MIYYHCRQIPAIEVLSYEEKWNRLGAQSLELFVILAEMDRVNNGKTIPLRESLPRIRGTYFKTEMRNIFNCQRLEKICNSLHQKIVGTDL